MQKGRPDADPDWTGLVTGTVAALTVLRPDAKGRRWRATVDRTVKRD